MFDQGWDDHLSFQPGNGRNQVKETNRSIGCLEQQQAESVLIQR